MIRFPEQRLKEISNKKDATKAKRAEKIEKKKEMEIAKANPSSDSDNNNNNNNQSSSSAALGFYTAAGKSTKKRPRDEKKRSTNSLIYSDLHYISAIQIAQFIWGDWGKKEKKKTKEGMRVNEVINLLGQSSEQWSKMRVFIICANAIVNKYANNINISEWLKLAFDEINDNNINNKGKDIQKQMDIKSTDSIQPFVLWTVLILWFDLSDVKR